MFRRVKLRHLQVFCEVARLDSVVKAADSLSVTQPAVSKTIRELEELLGVELFDRSKRGIVLSSFGELFLRHASASLTAVRQGFDAIGHAREAGDMPIRMGALPTVSTRLIPEAVHLFKRDGARDVIRVVTGENAVLVDQLRRGELDLVVGRLSDPDRMMGLAFEHLYSEQVCLVARAGHPLATGSAFRLEELARYTVLTPTPGAIIRPWVDRLMLTEGFGPLPDRIETVSTSFGRRYVLDFDALWFISRGVVADDIASGAMVALPIDATHTMGPVGLTTRVDLPPEGGAALLVQAIRKVARQIRDEQS